MRSIAMLKGLCKSAPLSAYNADVVDEGRPSFLLVTFRLEPRDANLRLFVRVLVLLVLRVAAVRFEDYATRQDDASQFDFITSCHASTVVRRLDLG